MTPWTVTHQAPLSIGFPKQEYWSGLPFPSPRDLSNPGIEHGSPAWQTDSLPLSHWGSPTQCTECESVKVLVTQLCPTLQPHGLWLTRFLCPWNSPGKNTGVGSHSFLQGNLPNPGIEPRSPTLQVDSLSSEGSPNCITKLAANITTTSRQEEA